MPALTKQTEDLRKVQALEAVKLMGMGVKKADACELHVLRGLFTIPNILIRKNCSKDSWQ